MAAIRIMNKQKFVGYKRYIARHVEEGRAKGKDWLELTKLIKNMLKYDCRYALTGKQIAELLELAF